MATKSVIEIDILDDKFKAFQAAFEKYQKALKAMPADWNRVNSNLNSVESTQRKINKSLADGSRALKDAAFYSGTVARNLASSAVSVAKWVALGAVGGGFGVGGLAASASDYRRRAQGLGVATGDIRAANATLGRYIAPEAALGNIADIQSDLSRQQILGRLGGQAGQTPAEMLPTIIRNVIQQFKAGGKTSQYAEAMGLTQVFSLEELRRLSSLTTKELEATISDFEKARKTLAVSDENNRQWQNFWYQLKESGQKLETSFLNNLVMLTPKLQELSKVVVEAIDGFLKSKELQDALTDFTKYLDSPEGKQAISNFFQGIGMVADFIFKTFGAVPEVARGLGIAGRAIRGGGDPQMEAVNSFMQWGLTQNQATGLVANLMGESGLNPGAVGDGGKAFGIAQWHPDRQADFKAKFGHDIKTSTFAEQLEFVKFELMDKEAKALQALRKANTVSEAVAAGLEYERPNPANRANDLEKRMNFAKGIQVKINNNTGGNAIATANALPGATQ